DIGAKIIVTESGLQFGTVGGGKVEAKAIQFAKELLSDKNPKEMTSNGLLLTWNLQTDVGMTCGGQVQLFFEKYFSNSWTIAVFGAGHVAQSVTRLLLGLNCQIHCVDPRKEWIDKLPDSPKLKKVCIPN